MAANPRPRRTATRDVSDLSNHTADVFHDAEQQPITISRHDGEDLLLLTRREYDARTALFELAGHVVTAVLDSPSVEIGLAQTYPWILALSDEDRSRCAEELVDAVKTASSFDESNRALEVLMAWRESAEAISSGLAVTPVAWLEEKIVVPRP